MSAQSVFTSAVKQHWANQAQDNLERELLGMEICKIEDIPNGTTKNLPFVNFQRSINYTKYSTVTEQPLITGNDQIVITETPMVPFSIDDIDLKDNYLDVGAEAISNASYILKSVVDSTILAQSLVAGTTYGSGGFNTTTPVALAQTAGVAYIPTVFGAPRARLTAAGANSKNLCMVVDSTTLLAISIFGMEKGFEVSDQSIQRGYKGEFLGMSVYESNNLRATRTLPIATNPTNGDTVLLNGVTFTFVTTLGTTPGNVLIAGSAAASLANLVSAVNGSAGAGTNYVAIADPYLVSFITATNNTTNILFTSSQGSMFARSTLTAVADKFGAETVNCMVVEKGAIRLAMRNEVTIKQVSDDTNLVEKFKLYSRFGVLTPNRGRQRMARICVEGTPAQ